MAVDWGNEEFSGSCSLSCLSYDCLGLLLTLFFFSFLGRIGFDMGWEIPHCAFTLMASLLSFFRLLSASFSGRGYFTVTAVVRLKMEDQVFVYFLLIKKHSFLSCTPRRCCIGACAKSAILNFCPQRCVRSAVSAPARTFRSCCCYRDTWCLEHALGKNVAQGWMSLDVESRHASCSRTPV